MRWVPRCITCLTRNIIGRFIGATGEYDGACAEHVEALKAEKKHGVFTRYY